MSVPATTPGSRVSTKPAFHSDGRCGGDRRQRHLSYCYKQKISSEHLNYIQNNWANPKVLNTGECENSSFLPAFPTQVPFGAHRSQSVFCDVSHSASWKPRNYDRNCCGAAIFVVRIPISVEGRGRVHKFRSIPRQPETRLVKAIIQSIRFDFEVFLVAVLKARLRAQSGDNILSCSYICGARPTLRA